MRGRRVLLMGLAAWLLVAAGPVLAHEGEEGSGIAVEPQQVTAGGTVVLSGTGLEADDERTLQLVGGDLTVQLGTVTTDADGMFAIELQIPGYLPGGTYQLDAIGDETLMADLVVTAAGAGAVVDPAATDAVVVPRAWTPVGAIVAIIAIALILLLGVALVRRSDRLARPPTASP
jgi:hypothetical protein